MFDFYQQAGGGPLTERHSSLSRLCIIAKTNLFCGLIWFIVKLQCNGLAKNQGFKQLRKMENIFCETCKWIFNMIIGAWLQLALKAINPNNRESTCESSCIWWTTEWKYWQIISLVMNSKMVCKFTSVVQKYNTLLVTLRFMNICLPRMR